MLQPESHLSSRVPINLADYQTLQRLRHIGTGRATRLIKYRQDVKAIESPAELALAAGMSPRLVDEIADDIDWSQEPLAVEDSNSVVRIASLLVMAIMLGFSLRAGSFDTSTAQIFSLGLGLLLAATTTSLMVPLARDNRPVTSHLELGAMTLAAAGTILVVAPAILGYWIVLPEAEANRLATTRALLLFALLATLLLYGPSIHFRLSQPSTPLQLGRHAKVADRLELLQFPLGLGFLFAVLQVDSVGRLTALAGLSIAAILGNNAVDLLQGRSPWQSALNNGDARMIDYLGKDIPSGSTGWMRFRGALLGLTAAALFLAAASALVKTL